MTNRRTADRITRRIMGQLKFQRGPFQNEEQAIKHYHKLLRLGGWKIDRRPGTWDIMADWKDIVIAAMLDEDDLTVKEWTLYDTDGDEERIVRSNKPPGVKQALRKLGIGSVRD